MMFSVTAALPMQPRKRERVHFLAHIQSAMYQRYLYLDYICDLQNTNTDDDGREDESKREREGDFAFHSRYWLANYRILLA
jgi:hypothetical protein